MHAHTHTHTHTLTQSCMHTHTHTHTHNICSYGCVYFALLCVYAWHIFVQLNKKYFVWWMLCGADTASINCAQYNVETRIPNPVPSRPANSISFSAGPARPAHPQVTGDACLTRLCFELLFIPSVTLIYALLNTHKCTYMCVVVLATWLMGTWFENRNLFSSDVATWADWCYFLNFPI